VKECGPERVNVACEKVESELETCALEDLAKEYRAVELEARSYYTTEAAAKKTRGVSSAIDWARGTLRRLTRPGNARQGQNGGPWGEL
jgi:hypothetical protein